MKARKWKMWASYMPGAKLPVVCLTKWGANNHKRAQEQPERQVFEVEVRELPRRRKGGKR